METSIDMLLLYQRLYCHAMRMSKRRIGLPIDVLVDHSQRQELRGVPQSILTACGPLWIEFKDFSIRLVALLAIL